MASSLVELIEQPISVEMTMADGVFVKTMGIQKAGTHVPQHSHTYDHTSVVARGSVELYQGMEYPEHPGHTHYILVGKLEAPKAILIKAGVKHLFKSLEDDTLVLCIHNVSRSGIVEIEEEHNLL